MARRDAEYRCGVRLLGCLGPGTITNERLPAVYCYEEFCGLGQRTGTADAIPLLRSPRVASIHFPIPGPLDSASAGITVALRSWMKIVGCRMRGREEPPSRSALTSIGEEWTPSRIPAFAGMTKRGARVYPGSVYSRSDDEISRGSYLESESQCVPSNRSSLLPPAHQGMKRRSCGLVQRIGTWRFLPRPTSTPAWDKPPHYRILAFALKPPAYNSKRDSPRGE